MRSLNLLEPALDVGLGRDVGYAQQDMPHVRLLDRRLVLASLPSTRAAAAQDLQDVEAVRTADNRRDVADLDVL